MSDDGQSGEVYFILKIDLILTGTSVDFLQRLRTPAQHFGKTWDDFIGMTAQHPGLGLSVDKKLIHQMPSRMLLNMVKHDRIVGLTDQGPHLIKLHRLTNMKMFLFVSSQELLQIKHGDRVSIPFTCSDQEGNLGFV